MTQKLSNYDHKLVRRIAAIINCIGSCGGPVRLTDIAGQTGLDTSTVYRILSELVREGFIYKNKSTRCYTPGLQICQLGGSEFARQSAVESLQPVMSQIEVFTGLTALLGFRIGSRIRLYSRGSSIPRHPAVEKALEKGYVDAHATSVGKILLSHLDSYLVCSIYKGEVFNRYSSKTIDNVTSLVRELQRVKKIGHASEYGEYAVGLNGIGIPVPTRTGPPTFGVWLTASSENMDQLHSEVALEQARAILSKSVNINSEH